MRRKKRWPEMSSQAPKGLSVVEYERCKFELADVIRAAVHYGSASKENGLQRDGQALLGKLASDRFNLAVVGKFSRGKSTLMNALFGMDRLPTGIVPVTSVITSVAYGTNERVVLRYEGSALCREVPLTELAMYVTERGNPGNKMGIMEAEVQLPADLLRRGFYFVDTPGLGSMIASNTETTRRFLPECDAIIFVTSFDSPFSADEAGFLLETKSHVRQVFVVINKRDLVSGDESAEVLRLARQQLAEEAGAANVEFFALSAREALEAKLAGDRGKLAASGLPDFVSALLEFLTFRKSHEFLASIGRRAEDLLVTLPVELRHELAARLAEVRSRFDDAAGRQANGHSEGANDKDSARHVSIGACVVCGHVVDKTYRFFSKYQYELSTSRSTQEKHIARHGFCPRHTWQYESIASPQGVSTAYPSLLESVSHELRSLADDFRKGNGAGGMEVKVGASCANCPACEVIRAAEENMVGRILSAIGKEEKQCPSVCLPHLLMLVGKTDEHELARELLRLEADRLFLAAENMQRFALKHDGLRRDLTSDEEWHAANLGLAMLVGSKRR
jgi:GTP-binding protein EngB required for normal cell division